MAERWFRVQMTTLDDDKQNVDEDIANLKLAVETKQQETEKEAKKKEKLEKDLKVIVQHPTLLGGLERDDVKFVGDEVSTREQTTRDQKQANRGGKKPRDNHAPGACHERGEGTH